ncbi:MAG: metallophosphoesterase [Shewanella sp.]
MIEKICASGFRNVYCVVDLHGEISKFNKALTDINFDKNLDLIISVGDLIDRGEDSLACLELVNEKWFKHVIGNHEDLMIGALVDKSKAHFECWMSNGGDWYLSLDDEERLLVNSIARTMKIESPTIIEVTDKIRKTVICHADICGDHYHGEYRNEERMHYIWSRDRIEKAKRDNSYNPVILGADIFIFGHTPLKTAIRAGNCLWIDTGAVFGNDLTIVKIN